MPNTPLSETKNPIRSKEDLLKMLYDCMDEDERFDNEITKEEVKISQFQTGASKRSITHLSDVVFKKRQFSNDSDACIYESKLTESTKDNSENLSLSNTLYYEVLWCKQSMRKHKKWEGDGILIITKFSAILKNLDGKEIARSTGNKMKEITELEEDSIFVISGKECQIQSRISEDEYKSRVCVKLDA